MFEWIAQINPWIGSAIAILGVVISYYRFRFEREREYAKEAADRNAFRHSLMEHIAHVEDNNRKLQAELRELESAQRKLEADHRREMAGLQEKYAEAQRRHLDCEERLLTLIRKKDP